MRTSIREKKIILLRSESSSFGVDFHRLHFERQFDAITHIRPLRVL